MPASLSASEETSITHADWTVPSGRFRSVTRSQEKLRKSPWTVKDTKSCCGRVTPTSHKERKWRGWDSNPRPAAYESAALPTELPRQGSAAGQLPSGNSNRPSGSGKRWAPKRPPRSMRAFCSTVCGQMESDIRQCPRNQPREPAHSFESCSSD